MRVLVCGAFHYINYNRAGGCTASSVPAVHTVSSAHVPQASVCAQTHDSMFIPE